MGKLMKIQECYDPRLINEAQKFTYLFRCELNILRKGCIFGLTTDGWNLSISNSFRENGLWLKPMGKENFRTDS